MYKYIQHTDTHTHTLGQFCDAAVVGQFCDATVVGQFCDAAAVGQFCDAAVVGHFCDAAVVGQFCDASVAGQSCDAAAVGQLCDAAVSCTNSISSVRICLLRRLIHVRLRSHEAGPRIRRWGGPCPSEGANLQRTALTGARGHMLRRWGAPPSEGANSI